MPAGLCGESEPGADGFGFVGGEVVEHDMYLEISGYVGVDPFEERQDVFAGVGFACRVEDFADADVQRREEVDDAVAFVVVRRGPASALRHG